MTIPLDKLLLDTRLEASQARRMLRFVGAPLNPESEDLGLGQAALVSLYEFFMSLGLEMDTTYSALAEIKPALDRHFLAGGTDPMFVSLIDNRYVHATGDERAYDLEDDTRVASAALPLLSICYSVSAAVERNLLPLASP